MAEFNIMVVSPLLQPTDKPLVFGDLSVQLVPETTTMVELLVDLGLFPSKSQARKNGVLKDYEFKKHAVKCMSIPPGYSEWFLGKLKHRINIWNPSE